MRLFKSKNSHNMPNIRSYNDNIKNSLDGIRESARHSRPQPIEQFNYRDEDKKHFINEMNPQRVLQTYQDFVAQLLKDGMEANGISGNILKKDLQKNGKELEFLKHGYYKEHGILSRIHRKTDDLDRQVSTAIVENILQNSPEYSYIRINNPEAAQRFAKDLQEYMSNNISAAFDAAGDNDSLDSIINNVVQNIHTVPVSAIAADNKKAIQRIIALAPDDVKFKNDGHQHDAAVYVDELARRYRQLEQQQLVNLCLMGLNDISNNDNSEHFIDDDYLQKIDVVDASEVQGIAEAVNIKIAQIHEDLCNNKHQLGNFSPEQAKQSVQAYLQGEGCVSIIRTLAEGKNIIQVAQELTDQMPIPTNKPDSTHDINSNNIKSIANTLQKHLPTNYEKILNLSKDEAMEGIINDKLCPTKGIQNWLNYTHDPQCNDTTKMKIVAATSILIYEHLMRSWQFGDPAKISNDDKSKLLARIYRNLNNYVQSAVPLLSVLKNAKTDPDARNLPMGKTLVSILQNDINNDLINSIAKKSEFIQVSKHLIDTDKYKNNIKHNADKLGGFITQVTGKSVTCVHVSKDNLRIAVDQIFDQLINDEQNKFFRDNVIKNQDNTEDNTVWKTMLNDTFRGFVSPSNDNYENAKKILKEIAAGNSMLSCATDKELDEIAHMIMQSAREVAKTQDLTNYPLKDALVEILQKPELHRRIVEDSKLGRRLSAELNMDSDEYQEGYNRTNHGVEVGDLYIATYEPNVKELTANRRISIIMNDEANVKRNSIDVNGTTDDSNLDAMLQKEQVSFTILDRNVNNPCDFKSYAVVDTPVIMMASNGVTNVKDIAACKKLLNAGLYFTGDHKEATNGVMYKDVININYKPNLSGVNIKFNSKRLNAKNEEIPILGDTSDKPDLLSIDLSMDEICTLRNAIKPINNNNVIIDLQSFQALWGNVVSRAAADKVDQETVIQKMKEDLATEIEERKQLTHNQENDSVIAVLEAKSEILNILYRCGDRVKSTLTCLKTIQTNNHADADKAGKLSESLLAQMQETIYNTICCDLMEQNIRMAQEKEAKDPFVLGGDMKRAGVMNGIPVEQQHPIEDPDADKGNKIPELSTEVVVQEEEYQNNSLPPVKKPQPEQHQSQDDKDQHEDFQTPSNDAKHDKKSHHHSKKKHKHSRNLDSNESQKSDNEKHQQHHKHKHRKHHKQHQGTKKSVGKHNNNENYENDTNLKQKQSVPSSQHSPNNPSKISVKSRSDHNNKSQQNVSPLANTHNIVKKKEIVCNGIS